jgi:hypothetical protein
VPAWRQRKELAFAKLGSFGVLTLTLRSTSNLILP